MDLYRQQFLWVAIIIAVIAILLLIWQWIRRNRTPRTFVTDELEGHDFEQFCAELLENKGFVDVEVTKGSGDYGIDILAEKEGVTYAIQCKRYQGPVGVEAVQQAYAQLLVKVCIAQPNSAFVDLQNAYSKNIKNKF